MNEQGIDEVFGEGFDEFAGFVGGEEAEEVGDGGVIHCAVDFVIQASEGLGWPEGDIKFEVLGELALCVGHTDVRNDGETLDVDVIGTVLGFGQRVPGERSIFLRGLQADNFAVRRDIDALGCGDLRQGGHAHDFAVEGDEESGAISDFKIAHGDGEAARAAQLP